MRNILLSIFLLIIAITGFLILKNSQNKMPTQAPSNIKQYNSTAQPSIEQASVTVLIKNLEIPWAIVFLPDKRMLFTERVGNLKVMDLAGNWKLITKISDVKLIGEGGLLGAAIHPDFSTNHFVYLYYTYSSNEVNTLNKVVRYKFENDKLAEDKIILDKIPGSSNHDGGRLKFGPDKLLYITTGDAENPSQAQDIKALGGKILRLKDDGSIPEGNPFNSPVYSYGHRNPQGLTWDSQGRLWETEHGPSGGSLGTGNDEVNLIEAGKNYGWPVIQGDETAPGMETPIINSTSQVSWAPSGLVFYNDSLYFGALKGQALFEFKISEKKLIPHFKGEYGRIRDAVLGPDNMLYITTSNRDGRGSPTNEDDKIIRINPEKL